ncbi:MAG: KTSC domain-containing protein [Candidatus Pacebacteria bacterium]|nr:KTSC domain-containing protein [Candidatus Paceibacterota bacterium]
MAPRTYTAPQDYSKDPRPAIALTPVKSNQVKAVGYDADTLTLAVTFTRGAGAIYHYPNVTPEAHAAFVGAESIGKYFGQHIQPLPFFKYAPDPVPESEAA